MATTSSIPSDFFIEIANFQRDHDALRAVREPVFQVEQQVPEELEWDALDPTSRHVLARDLAGRPIGTGRLTPDHHIGRMAVLADWRDRGVGAAMLTALIDLARELRYPEVKANAQVHAMPFYARAGFVPEGEEFIEADIPHRTMRLGLTPMATVERAAPPPRPDTHERTIESFEECRQAVLELLRAAHHRVWIYSRDLDPALFATEPAQAELRRLAQSGRGADLRILVQDPGSAHKAAMPLVELIQRLSSTVQVRATLDEVDMQYPAAFLLNDDDGYLFRPLGSRFEGSANTHGVGRHRQLLREFEQVWERSEPPVELRALRI